MLRPSLRLALALIVPAAGAFALSTAARANVRTTIPGAICQAETIAEPGVAWSYPNGDGSIIAWNQSNDVNLGFQVSCPLTRALPLATAGLSDLEIRFEAMQFYSGTRPVGCDAVSLRPDGTIADAHSMQMGVPGVHSTPDGDVSETVLMDFGSALSTSVSKGTYFLSCFMWPNVALRSIYHSEVDGINGN